MHWLQSLDSALFHFINSGLSNPFFDWLMPLLSGRGVPWLGAVILGGVAVICWGTTRLRLCVLCVALVVALGDPLIVGTLKDAVSRPRPFVTHPDARYFGEVGTQYIAPLANGMLPPNANLHSFPSAHAANCFAVATLLFLFYRRTAWFMFPFAASVAFSRVYNGVHYPSDVCVGAILGAGYAIAFLVLAQMLWNLIGKRAFPAWHAQLPYLLNPEWGARSAEPTNPAGQIPNADAEWLRLGYFVIIAALIGRWLYIRSGIIGLSEDEAYQWLWSKHLALSYYSKPPGIALIQWAGTALWGDTNFGVRFFSPVFAAILSVLVLRFMAREVGARAAFCLLLITFVTPLLILGSVLMTIDPPLVLCWMWAVIAGWRAVQPDGKTHDWLIAGLALGLGFLCKYTAMLQIICWMIFFALQPSARIHLKRIGPWLALLVFGLCTLPVIIWNAQHDWITVNHVAGDAGMHSAWKPTLDYFLQFTGGELGAFNPIFFIGVLWAMVSAWKRRADKPLWLFLLCLSAPLFLGYWLFSFHSATQLNWIAAAVPPLFCLMVAVGNESWPRVKPWFTAALLLGTALAVFMYDPDILGHVTGLKLPGGKDPWHAHLVRGGRETAQVVESERMQFDPHAFILADHYGRTGIYSFYSAPARAAAVTPEPLVYCLDLNRTNDQFAFWDEYNYRKHCPGQNALFVIHLDPLKLEAGWIWKWLRHEPIATREDPAPLEVPGYVAADFESVTNLGIRDIKLSDGRVYQRVQLFGCYHLK